MLMVDKLIYCLWQNRFNKLFNLSKKLNFEYYILDIIQE
jgi:hypothetical protein